MLYKRDIPLSTSLSLIPQLEQRKWVRLPLSEKISYSIARIIRTTGHYDAFYPTLKNLSSAKDSTPRSKKPVVIVMEGELGTVNNFVNVM